MKVIRPTWRDARVATLRARYSELQRLREYVQQHEGQSQDAAGHGNVELGHSFAARPVED
jgi:hypothetical protein